MAEQINYDTLVRMLRTAMELIRREQATLSSLDAAIGDGDHGTAMRKVADAIERAIESRSDGNVSAMLADAGWAALDTDAGSSGPLCGLLLMGMSEAVGGGPLDASAFARMLQAGVANVRTQTPAAVGDKTMLDALVPAVDAIQAAADAGQSVTAALAAGADAAVAGADATTQFQAKFGRARNLRERSIGHEDPGAVSMSLFFIGLKEGFSHAGS